MTSRSEGLPVQDCAHSPRARPIDLPDGPALPPVRARRGMARAGPRWTRGGRARRPAPWALALRACPPFAPRARRAAFIRGARTARAARAIVAGRALAKSDGSERGCPGRRRAAGGERGGSLFRAGRAPGGACGSLGGIRVGPGRPRAFGRGLLGGGDEGLGAAVPGLYSAGCRASRRGAGGHCRLDLLQAALDSAWTWLGGALGPGQRVSGGKPVHDHHEASATGSALLTRAEACCCCSAAQELQRTLFMGHGMIGIDGTHLAMIHPKDRESGGESMQVVWSRQTERVCFWSRQTEMEACFIRRLSVRYAGIFIFRIILDVFAWCH